MSREAWQGKTAHRERTDLTRVGGKSDGGEQQRGAGSSEQL